MASKKYPAMKDRRDIGRVEFAIEKMIAAREISSCCIGVEALIESGSKSTAGQIKKKHKSVSTR